MPCELAETYVAFNKRYFRGHLPPVDIDWMEPNPEDRAHCITHRRTTNEGREILLGTIRVCGALKEMPNVWKLALLHEMAHWKLRFHPICGHDGRGDSHGHAFQREMKRLARIGAFKRLW